MSKTTDDSKVESGLVGGNKSAAEHHDGGHHIQITNIKFNGSNYLRWSQSVRAYLRGRRKLEDDPKAHLKCDYCGRTRHTRDTCWKLNPEKRFSRNKEHSRANNVSSSGSFTKEQLDQLVALLKPQLASSGNSSGLLAQAGGEMQDMGHKNPTRELQVYHRRKTAPSTSVPDIQHTDDQPHSPGSAIFVSAGIELLNLAGIIIESYGSNDKNTKSDKDRDVEQPILDEQSDSSTESGFEEEDNELSDEDFGHLVEHENIVNIPFHSIQDEDSSKEEEQRGEDEGPNSKRYNPN
ncbi:hypothetical protein LINPERPRIM_LOCUS21261 [Linum perenne]